MRDLIRWAKAVADGDPLDPAHAAASGDPARDRLIQQFQIVAEIARLHKTAAAAGDAADPGVVATSGGAAQAPSPHDGPAWGHLQLVERIGQGTFGDVYRAWDPRLDRFVALKLLYREEGDTETVAGLEPTIAIEEGRLLARLRHPNVVSVFGADRIDGRVGIWMELIHGRTLEDIIATHGPLGAQEATLIGLDCCRALASIHQAGLLHRDLKARNVMRERGGRIVVMDLGSGRPNASQPLTTHPPPQDLVGTPLYLAPEIFAGKPASIRSDLYSLGVLLYFLVTGTTPVTGANASEVRANHEADKRLPLREARPDLPEDFIRAVQRALAPDPADRVPSAAALAESLPRFGAIDSSDQMPAGFWGRDASSRRRRRAILWSGGVIALLLATTIGALLTLTLRPPPRLPETRVLVTMPEVRIESVAMSPDGETLALAGLDPSGVSRLWLRPLDALDARPVLDTEGAAYPFWSPDGGSIGFFAKGRLWIVSAAGGAPRAIAEAPMARGGTWGHNDQIVYAPAARGPLYRISATQSGPPQAVTTLAPGQDEVSHRWPVFLPDGKRVAFLRLFRPASKSGTYVTALDHAPPRKLLDATAGIALIGPNLLVYPQDANLLAQQVDLDSLRVIGEPRAITPQLAFRPDTRSGVFGVSSGNSLAFGVGTPSKTRFDVHDRAGRVLFSREVPGLVRNFSLSPDGRWLAIERLDPQEATDDIWLLDLESEQLVRLTSDPANETDPIWSPDGRELLFSSDRRGYKYDLYRRPSEPGGTETLLSTSTMSIFAEDWSSDGSIVYLGGDDGARLLYLLAPGQTGNPELLLPSHAQMDEPAFSPDGRLIAYHSTDSGGPEVFVTRTDDRTRRWQVSRGGVQARWRADGKEIFYLAPDGQMMATPVLSEEPFQVGAARALFPTALIPTFLLNDYVASGDGQRFIVKRQLGGQVTRVAVILNWRSPWGNP